MSKNYIDLHMHSLYSDDGQYTPKKLVQMCSDKGIRIMAIADHNWTKAVAAGKASAEKLGIQLISAIEIDCTYAGKGFHLLGYGVNPDNPVWNGLGDAIMKQELAASAAKLKATNELGFAVAKEDMDAISPNGVYTGEMFGEVLLAKEEYQDHPMLAPYREGGSRSDNPYVNFYWDFYAQGKPCYTAIEYPAMKDMIELIHKDGGKAVLAHPGQNLKGCYELFDQMASELDLDGVEAFSNYHSAETVEYFYKKSRDYDLGVTCGSDFHGKTKPAIELGECRCPYDEEFIEQTLSRWGLVRSI